MCKKIFWLLIFCLATQASAFQNDYDIVVAGAGTSGIAAAIQASRMGMNVLVVEPTNLLGGQAIAAGVSNFSRLQPQ